jgi:outer membrane protein OmpA-like peptidoglycan-associated protein
MKKFIPLAVTTALLAACASAPQRSESIEQARAEIQTLAMDPMAQQVAASDLQTAQARLQDAQTALSQKEPAAAVDHLAYLARRHAEAGMARIETARAQAEVAHAQEQRSNIILAARAAEADQAKAQLAQTQQELADLKAKQTDRGMVVTLADVLFDTGQATLKPGADLTLDHLAHYMQDNPHTRILIEGFTDSVGSDAYNDALSQRRADTVASALVRRGVPDEAVRAIGRGKSFPVATNDTSAGRQANRRVEIVFSDASGRFAQANEDAAARR